MPGAAKMFRDLRYWVFYRVLTRRGVELVKLGDEQFGLQWTICPAGLNSESVVYSAGIGDDISFEHALVKRFGCDIVMCDPSPVAARTMAQPANGIPKFHFHPLALAGHTGHIGVVPHTDKQGQTWFARDDAADGSRIECIDLGSLMNRNGHSRIDLLKLDIEASEYDVIEDLVRKRIPVHQICVEYHHGILPGITRMQSVRSMFKLFSRGYRRFTWRCATIHSFR
jgi:FkbM family methyltransferase